MSTRSRKKHPLAARIQQGLRGAGDAPPQSLRSTLLPDELE